MKVGEKKGGKLLVFVSISVAVVVILMNLIQILVVSSKSRSELKSNAKEQYEEFAKTHAISIKKNIEMYFARLDFYTKSDVVRTRNSEEIWDWLKANASKRDPSFSYVAWADADGNFYSDINTIAKIGERDYWQAIMREGKEHFVDNPVTSKTSGRTVLHICQAAKIDGRNVGFFCGVLEIQKIAAILDDFSLGNIGSGALFDGNGNLIVSSIGNDKFTAEIQKIQQSNKSDYDKLMNSVKGHKDSFYQIKDSSSNDILIFTVPIEHTPMTFIIFLHGSEIFKVSNQIVSLLILGGLIFAFLIILTTAVILWKSIKPLSVVESTIREIATGDADLTKRIELNGNNEIARVVQGFNQFSAKLQTIISEMKTSKNDLVGVGSKLQASTNETSAAISQIISNIDSMADGVEAQIQSVNATSGAVNEIASNIESLNRMIESQVDSVSSASESVEKMTKNIAAVTSHVENMASSFSELERKAAAGISRQNEVNAEIAEIEAESLSLQETNTVISGIAEQTNLLAMNAAIEAAHAGEAGKGFAVVADEIRKLSEDSGSQSQTIRTQLSKISETISKIVESSRVTAEAFEEVSQEISNTTSLVREITSAMEEQNENSELIFSTLSQMNNTSAEVRTASKEMAEGNRAILDEIRALQDASLAIRSGMEEMSAGAKRIDETGSALSNLSSQMKDSIDRIGEQVDQFKV